MPGGRPTDYNGLIVKEICDLLADGMSLRRICTLDAFPSKQTVLVWLDRYPEFAAQYARARELQADHYAAEIIDLADTPVIAEKVTIKADGSEERVIGDAVDRTRLQIDSRKWYAGKLAPKKYGEKVHQEVSGEVSITRIVVPARIATEQSKRETEPEF